MSASLRAVLLLGVLAGVAVAAQAAGAPAERGNSTTGGLLGEVTPAPESAAQRLLEQGKGAAQRLLETGQEEETLVQNTMHKFMEKSVEKGREGVVALKEVAQEAGGKFLVKGQKEEVVLKDAVRKEGIAFKGAMREKGVAFKGGIQRLFSQGPAILESRLMDPQFAALPLLLVASVGCLGLRAATYSRALRRHSLLSLEDALRLDEE